MRGLYLVGGKDKVGPTRKQNRQTPLKLHLELYTGVKLHERD